jgi:UDP-GlcNAc:undecaprenyl-phosphate GlcNAc-1-phosphate transferase
LVAFGLSERQAVLVLYAVAIAAGVVGAFVESLDYTLSLALLAAYLGKLKVVDAPQAEAQPFARIMQDLTYRRRLLEIALDFFIISITYYLALWVGQGFEISVETTELFLQSLPVVLLVAYTAFFAAGVYRGVWRYLGISDLARFGLGVAGAGAAAGLLMGLVPGFQAVSGGTLFIEAVFLFLGLAGSRASFKILDQLYERQTRTTQAVKSVLLYDAGDLGELALRWIERSGDLGYRVVGFLDDDAYKIGRRIHGIEVVGTPADLEAVLEQRRVDGIILAASSRGSLAPLQSVCQAHGVWLRRMQVGFNLVN